MIERYLAELEASLRRARVPSAQRRRLLAEVEDHLLADPDAVERFGVPDELARGYALEAARRRSLPASLVLLGATLAYVLPVYAIPENTLPPAPPEGLPGYLRVLLAAALAAFAVALVAAVTAVAVGRVRPLAMAVSAGSLVVSSGFGLAAAVAWPTARPLTYALAVPAAVVTVGLALASLAWAAWPSSRRIATSQT